MRPKKRGVPAILPREPLTQKAKAAIYTYAEHYTAKNRFIGACVKRVLEAERMRRVDLYAWLEKHGYRWEPKLYKSFWHKVSQP